MSGIHPECWFPFLHVEVKPMNGTPAEAQVQNMTALTISSRSTIHLARLARRADPVHCRMPDEVMCRVWGLQTIGSQWRLFVTVAVLLSDTEDAALGWADWLDGEGWEGLQLVSSVKVREPIPIRIRFILLVAYQSLLRIFVRLILQTVPLSVRMDCLTHVVRSFFCSIFLLYPIVPFPLLLSFTRPEEQKLMEILFPFPFSHPTPPLTTCNHVPRIFLAPSHRLSMPHSFSPFVLGTNHRNARYWFAIKT